MPQGNAHILPHGIWHFDPATSKISTLLMKTGLKLAGLAAFCVAVHQFRCISWNYTHKDFIGRTMSFGNLTKLTHEPLSAKEIDELKAKQAGRKN